MRTSNCALGLSVSLLPIISTLLQPVYSGPPVNVALEASFPSPPWILELLEAAATENESSFVPLLDTIATGEFRGNDEQAYTKFLQVLAKDKHLTDKAAIASFKLSLATHETAPRLQAHFQFWEASVRHFHDDRIPVFAAWKPGLELCLDAECSKTRKPGAPHPADHSTRILQFDRRHVGKSVDTLWTLYVDPASEGSLKEYREWRSFHPDSSFRVRYFSSKPSSDKTPPLRVSGYGVELALKKTDYIVIDDRESEGGKATEPNQASTVNLDSQNEDADLKPLSSSELRELGMRSSSYVMQSDDPFETLVRVSQDFPKYAAALAQHNSSNDFRSEHRANRDIYLPDGYNMLWVNGAAVSPRQVDIFSLLDHLRRERKLVGGIEKLGFTAGQAIALLSNPALTEAQSDDGPRYDWRDDTDGGDVIMWLNDIEKDKRYERWPTGVEMLLQRFYPGQMPTVRKDLQNVVYIADLTNPKEVQLVVEVLQSLVKRMVVARFGIVPNLLSAGARDQAKVAYYLAEAYGLGAVMHYLQLSLEKNELSSPSESAFNAAVADRSLRRNKEAKALSEAKSSQGREGQIQNTAHYLKRLGANVMNPPIFTNGVPVMNDEHWMQGLSAQMTHDLQTAQEAVYDEEVTQDTWLPSLFLKSASLMRNALIVPEDEKQVQLFDVTNLYEDFSAEMKDLQPPANLGPDVMNLILILDVNSKPGLELLLNALEFTMPRDDVHLAFKHRSLSEHEKTLTAEGLNMAKAILENERPSLSSEDREKILTILKHTVEMDTTAGQSDVSNKSPLMERLGLKPGDMGILLNGRLVGPIPSSSPFTSKELDTLVSYERKKRIAPVLEALSGLNLTESVKTTQDMEKLSSILALSTVSDVPEGIFDNDLGPRRTLYSDWTASHTCIETGDAENSPIEVVASVDPFSEVGQRWIPIFHTLSKIDGVRTRVFLNPTEKLEELPVKRFYRQVLTWEPTFKDGALETQKAGAEFLSIPSEALLTVGLDTPPSWLVAPKKSEDDLDNIKLNSVKNPSSGVDALYELEHILIEGHSRETASGQPPRGTQLVLSTEESPNFAKTIIMANLGYFQFKANPGVYELALDEGRSKEIFKIDSAGTMGYGEHAGDDTTDILLMSFQGATVFPRLSRYPGKEEEDVLVANESASQKLMSSTQGAVEAAADKARDLVSKGSKIADGLLAKAGLNNVKTGEYISKGLGLEQNVLSNSKPPTAPAHADINIFSVASGHLYERMLNIMILSVMKHTNHTVKFWFIEQFLSPSFKTFLPTMAAEYNFKYEMVTFTWPHWLRAQKEKQRIIWGYKILFLDVLFPLDLDKVIFVDADQIVRTDMYDLVTHDLQGAPYGFTPMCDSRTEMEGFRFWKQGYWKSFLRDLPYHISALYVVDLKQFRAMAAGDRLRQQYHALSADPNSLSNLDQDLPNHMQMSMPIHSLPQDWLWCETWCSDESLKSAKTIDLCNNPQTKEPKLDRARRQVPEWTEYDEEIAALAKGPQGKEVPVTSASGSAAPSKSASIKDEL